MENKKTNEGYIAMEKSISEITEYLFNRDYDEELTDEEDEALWDVAKQQIKDFGWENTFESWKEYLFSKCITPESVVNFANLFWCYCLGEYVIADPYNFLGYMYYRIDMNPNMMILIFLTVLQLPYCQRRVFQRPT